MSVMKTMGFEMTDQRVVFRRFDFERVALAGDGGLVSVLDWRLFKIENAFRNYLLFDQVCLFVSKWNTACFNFF